MRGRRRKAGYLEHIASWRFIIALVVVFSLDYCFEHTTVAERATLGAFDAASERLKARDITHTAVVAISAADVERYFGGRRPIPAAGLDSIVRRLLSARPEVLVVDVFTDGAGYADSLFTDSLLMAEQGRLVWAQAVDSVSGEVLPVLGGAADPPGTRGLAAILMDEDHLVRRFRPRYLGLGTNPGSDTIPSLPLAAASVFAATNGDTIRLTRRLPSDTGSIALRTYVREPPFYLLDDVMTALSSAGNGRSPFEGRVVVLGFVDGSDQVLTPRGVQTGPEVVADAIETLLDTRGAIRRLPTGVEWGAKLALSFLIAFIHYRLRPRPAIWSMIGLAAVVVWGGFWMFEHLGYWSNFILIVVGVWIEQLYEEVTRSPQHG